MKKYISFCLILALLSLSDCEKDDRVLTGVWRLTERLSDPGDGSGIFTPVDSERTIRFSANGTYTANEDICDFLHGTSSPSSGQYDLEENRLMPEGCVSAGFNSLGIEVNGRELIISYLCEEGCRHKYKRYCKFC